MKRNNDGTIGCGCMIAMLLIFYLPIVFWTDRNLDFWLSYAKGVAFDAPLWWSFLIALIEPVVFLNFIAEIFRAVMFG